MLPLACKSLALVSAVTHSAFQHCWASAVFNSASTASALRSCSSRSSSSAGSVESEAPGTADAEFDAYYWHPHEDNITLSSIAQRRAVGKIENAIESVLLSDAAIREQLVDRYGLTIHRIQLSRDRRSVFILWDANQGMAQQCEKALEKNAFRLRRDLAKNLKSKFTPYLEFRHNHLPPLQAAVAATMEQVEKEATTAAGAGQGPQVSDVEAAIARLEDITRAKEA